MRSLADAIEAGGMNLCCLKEENLYLTENTPSRGRAVRKCRVCGTSHYTIKTDPYNISAMLDMPNFIKGRKGKRHFTMPVRERK